VAIVFNDRVADGNAFVADIRARVIAWGRNKFANYVLAFVAEGTAEGIVRSGALQADSPKERKIERSLTLITLDKSSISTVFAPESLKRARIVEIFAGRPVARGPVVWGPSSEVRPLGGMFVEILCRHVGSF
jgi:hypothetical protein